MKKAFLTAGVLLLTLVNVSVNFIDMNSTPYGEYRPVLMKRADLEKSVSYRPEGRALINPGKIYSKPPYIYINERYKGIHVVNNTDPRHPVKEGFIVAPGCIDMAVKEQILYLDNSVDLVAFDLTAREVTHRVKNIFPQPIAPDNSIYYGLPDDDMVVVEWKKNP
jgi:hypothetical protein